MYEMPTRIDSMSEELKDGTTEFGFKFGDALVERVHKDKDKGWTIISIKTSRKNQELQVYVTKTGKVRVFKYHVKEMKEPSNG